MIRTKNKIVAELNPDNVVNTQDLTLRDAKLIQSNGYRRVTTVLPNDDPELKNLLMIADGSGQLIYLVLGLPNKVIATNETGNIVLIDRSELL